MRYGWVLGLCLVLLSACGGADDTAPVDRVRAFVAATEARNVDQMVALMAPEDRRDAGWQLRQAMTKVESLEYRDPQYKLESVEDATAFVQVSGLLVARTSDGKETQVQVNQLLELVKQDDTWYITGNGIEPPPTSP